jgi:phosphopantetheine--protein transferase-like protein
MNILLTQRIEIEYASLILLKLESKKSNSRNADSRQENSSLVELAFPELCGNEATLVYDEFGKPWPGNVRGFVSISHSKNWFAVSYSESHIQGIDIESIRPKLEVISPRFLHPDELSWLASQDQRQKALQIFWGAKEAMYKAYGKKRLQFNRDIRVSEFDPQHPSKFKGWVDSPDGILNFELCWQMPEEDTFLVLVCGNTSNPI